MENIIIFFGSKKKVADALGVDPAAVSYWLRCGLPPKRAIEIERLSNGLLLAKDTVGTCRDDS